MVCSRSSRRTIDDVWMILPVVPPITINVVRLITCTTCVITSLTTCSNGKGILMFVDIIR